MRDRTTGLQRQPRRALTQLVAVLLRGSHTTDTVPLPRTKSWLGGVRQSQPASKATATPTLTAEQQVRQKAYAFTTAVANGDADRACALMRKTGDQACHMLFYNAPPDNYVAPVVAVRIHGERATATLPVGGWVHLRRDGDWY